MKIAIEATEKIVDFDGVQVRAWKGVTEGGVECVVFVHRIAVREDLDAREFERELQERLRPGRKFSIREVL